MKEILDTRRLKSPAGLEKVARRSVHMKPGSILEVLADCPTFENDLRAWCWETGRLFLSVESDGGNKKRIQIRF